MMKNVAQKSIAFAVLLVAVLGCSAVNEIKKEVEKTQSPQVLNSTDNTFQLTVPGNWKTETEMSEVANLQASNRFGETYVMVVRDSRKDFGKKADLDFMTKVVQDNFKRAATDATFSAPVSVTINGYPAQQFEANGEVENMKLKYLYGIVETPENFYQVITWTLASRFDANREMFVGMINSFKETGADGAIPAAPTAPKSK